MNALIGRLVPVVLRHLDGYAEIAGEDARDAGAHIARRLIALLVAGACAFVALLMACGWLLILAWDTPWRAWTAAGLAIFFGASAVALAWPAFKGGDGPHTLFFPRVRSELVRDRELIERAFNGRGEAGNGDEQRTE